MQLREKINEVASNFIVMAQLKKKFVFYSHTM